MRGRWSPADRDAFAASLRAEGADEETVARWASYLDRVTAAAAGERLLPMHVDEAIRVAESHGAGGAELADLQLAGDAMVRFARELPQRGAFATGTPSEESVALEIARAPRSTAASARLSRPPPSVRPGKRPPPVRGRCAECGGTLALRGERAPLFLMTGGGALGAIATFAALELLGGRGVIAALGAAAACVLFVSALFAGWACERCAVRAGGARLSEEQRRELASVRVRYALAVLGTIVVTAIGVASWASLIGR